MDYNYYLKFIIVGDANVGKSCLLLRFIDNKYRDNHDITIGVEFGMKIIKLDDKRIKLQIWDTAGQEAFRSIIRCYYRNSAGVILVYDITNRQSFNNVKFWLNEIKNYTSDNTSIILVGNKCDLDTSFTDNISLREVSENEGKELANEYNLLFIESSAKNSYNIDNIFTILSNNIINKITNVDINTFNNNGIRVGNYNHNNLNDYKKCCH